MPVKPLVKPKKIKKKTKTLVGRITDSVAWFLGSWWAVVFHTAWFTLWLILNFDVSLLTFSVSLEAIFIGIFLLMAANKAELKRDLREMKQRRRDRERIEYDINLDERENRRLAEMKTGLKAVQEEIKEVKKLLSKS